MSNFEFLKTKWPELAANGQLAENYLYCDPNAAIFKTRLFAEKLIDLFLVTYQIDSEIEVNFYDKIRCLSRVKNINPAIVNLFTLVRRIGNKAAHDNYNDVNDAKECIRSIFKLSAWLFVRVTGSRSAVPKTFIWPSPDQPKSVASVTYDTSNQVKQEKENEAHQAELSQLKRQLEAYPDTLAKTEKDVAAVTNELELSEEQTRKILIDAMLKEAGWNIQDQEQVQTELVVTPFPSPSGAGKVDYVLFDRVKKPIAIVEAKKTAVNPEQGQHQAKLYADCLEAMYHTRPVIFYTNGHETWIWDDKHSEPRQIWGMYTYEDLDFLRFQHQNRQPLRTAQIDSNIVERSYQIEGIKRAYEAYESGRRRALLVMATGSGKTRVAIALVKGMLQTAWAKRILFLADRDELVEQAMNKKNSFKTFLPENTRVRITSGTFDNREACIYFATYQTMIKYYDQFSVGYFDLIIADESHRSIYKCYRDILEYFDAYLLGLTATPVDFINRNTFNFFECRNGDPTFHYSYQEAYNHVPPYLLRYQAIEATTSFLRQGIHWNELTEEQKRQIEEDGLPEELIDFDREKLEQFVTNRDTNEFIIRTLMNKGIKVGDAIGKSIIFARNTAHASILLEIFNDLYPQYKGKLAAVIHSKIINHQDLLNDFKEKDRPRVAISVDMLDTGVDVPEVVNLSFAKPVYSKVKFLQMIGRGTRLCPNLFGKGQDKKNFIIFDHWQNFRFFEINPEGDLPSESKSTLQIRFELRIKLLELFFGQRDLEKQREIIVLLREDIASLPERSIEVKKHWKTLAFLKQDQAWQVINDQLMTALKLKIAPLMQWVDVEGQLDAIWFDNEIHRMQYFLLSGDRQRVAKQLDSIINEIHRLKTNLNQFANVRTYVESLKQYQTWMGMDFNKLEECRKILRDLMKFRSSNMPKTLLRLDVIDTGYQINPLDQTAADPAINMDEYVKRVETALQNELQMQLVIYKIRKGQRLTEFDMDSVYRIFDSGKFDFTLDEMARNAQINKEDLNGLLRRFVGVDEAELNERFRMFVLAHPGISPTQIRILEMVKNDILQHRGISFASLYQGHYTTVNSQGIDGVFGPKLTDEVISLIEPYRVEDERLG